MSNYIKQVQLDFTIEDKLKEFRRKYREATSASQQRIIKAQVFLMLMAYEKRTGICLHQKHDQGN